MTISIGSNLAGSLNINNTTPSSNAMSGATQKTSNPMGIQPGATSSAANVYAQAIGSGVTASLSAEALNSTKGTGHVHGGGHHGGHHKVDNDDDVENQVIAALESMATNQSSPDTLTNSLGSDPSKSLSSVIPAMNTSFPGGTVTLSMAATNSANP